MRMSAGSISSRYRDPGRWHGIVVGPCTIRNGWVSVYWLEPQKYGSYPKSCIRPLPTANPQEGESEV